MYVAIIIFSLIFSAQAQCFARCSQDTIEVAWRQYANSKYNATIYLLGLTHWAPEEFYDNVQNFIIDKHVIYEGIGDSLEDRELVLNYLSTLDLLARQLFFALHSWQGMKNCLNQVNQPQFDYSRCSSVAHADLALIDTPEGRIFHGVDNQLFTTTMRKLAAEYLGEVSIEIDYSTVERIVKKKAALLMDASPKQHFECQRKLISAVTTRLCPLRSNVINCGIIGNINELLLDSRAKDIVIVFGVSHLPAIEEALKLMGWEQIHETWHQVAAL